MTLGKKIRNVRQQQGYSQEKMAQKLCVSRQAITKWEADRGIPDIANLKAISSLLNVSIDYLLDDEKDAGGIDQIVKKPIDFSIYPHAKGNGLTEDYVVTEHYPNADSIYEYVRRRKLDMKEKIMDFIGIPGILETVDKWRDSSIFYLVEQGSRQYWVNVTKEFIISKRLAQRFNGVEKEIVIGDNSFIHSNRKIKHP